MKPVVIVAADLMSGFAFAVVAVFVSFLSACGGEPLATQTQGAEQALIGTFEPSSSKSGEIVRLVLMTDQTAHLELTTSVIDGFYKRVDGPGGGSLTFFDEKQVTVYSADYQYDGAVLNVMPSRGTEWQSLFPADAFCTTAPQCESQQLPHLMCPGQWSCVSNSCLYQCHAGP